MHRLPMAPQEIAPSLEFMAKLQRYENDLGAAGMTVKVATTGAALLP